MRDAWIYSQDTELAAELVLPLAELGFTPRRMGANGSALPAGTEAGGVRRPGLLVVAAGPAEPSPDAVVERLHDNEELRDVPLLAVVDPAHLPAPRMLESVHELLVRPFAPAEVEARVARARQRASGIGEGEVVRAGSLEVNVASYEVSVAGEPVGFAHMEYALLRFLITHPNRVYPREALLSAVWGYDYYGGARTVDVHVRRVRAKLGPEHAERIKTVRGVGYRFEL